MTEVEWFSCNDPEPMLRFLRGRVSERKLRLFAVACCRRVQHACPDDEQDAIRLVDLAESYADRAITRGELVDIPAPDYGSARHFENAARLTAAEAGDSIENTIGAAETAGLVVGLAAYIQMSHHHDDGIGTDAMMKARKWERRAQAHLLRDIVGNPFHPFE